MGHRSTYKRPAGYLWLVGGLSVLILSLVTVGFFVAAAFFK